MQPTPIQQRIRQLIAYLRLRSRKPAPTNLPFFPSSKSTASLVSAGTANYPLSIKNSMDKVTVVTSDVSVDYFPQSYTDAAVAAALAAQTPVEATTPTEVHVTDGEVISIVVDQPE